MRSLIVSIAIATGACAHATSEASPRAPTTVSAKNVILMIADGAGIAHWTLALFEKSDLAVRQFPITGFVDTRGADHVVTGSAPAGTALASGVRTYMGAVGVDPNNNPVETVLDRAMSRGKATGLLTTTVIWDATPAAFAAHSPRRYRYEEITTQMVRKGVDVLMGGGRRFFRPAQRRDSTDLIAELREGYTYVETAEELARLDLRTVDRLAGLFAEGEMGPTAGRSPSLVTMTESAIAVLSHDPDGFFLMVENEETDTQAHANEPAEKLTADVISFDDAIRVALDYQSRDPATLIVVTADHETGGITLPHDSLRNVVINYSTESHTGVMVPIFAKGPGAEQFSGILENREVGRKLMEIVNGR